MKFTLVFLLGLLTGTVSAQGFLPEYTILHYGNGFNDLDPYIQADLNQMEIIGSTRKIQVVAQLGSQQAKSAYRFHIQKDNDPKRITSPVVQKLGMVDMGNWKALADFVIWGMKNYPAKRYFVIVGGHGDGWKQPAAAALAVSSPVRAISPDFNSGNQITTTQLAQAFEAVRRQTGKQVDVFGADACLMGSIEVAVQLSSGVKYMVASQEVEPGEGWVYQDFLMRLNRESDMSGKNVARLGAKSYMDGYRSFDKTYYTQNDLTISATDLSEAVKFSAKLGKLTRIIKNAPNRKDYDKAARSSGKFYETSYIDVGRFLSNVGTIPMREADRLVVKDLINDYESKVVIREHASKSRDFSTGLHMWIPRNPREIREFLPAYTQMFFNRLNNWGSLFANY